MGKTTERQKLNAFPVLKFFASFLDPEQEEDPTSIVASLCEEFSMPCPTDHRGWATVNNALSEHISKEHKKELYFEIAVDGVLRVWRQFQELTYTAKDGENYKGKSGEVTVWEVNGREIKFQNGWDDYEMWEYKDAMLALFDQVEHVGRSWPDYFNQCWAVFDKGSKDQSRDAFNNTCERLWDKFDKHEHSISDMGSRMSHWARFIQARWCDYIWNKYEEGKDSTYWLGLKEFILRNRDTWLEGKEVHFTECRVYTDTHVTALEEYAKMFEEGGLKSIEEMLILLLWMHKRNTRSGWLLDGETI